MTATATAIECFDLMGTLRAVRNDKSLSTTQKGLLWCAALRADNDSDRGRTAGRVRASLELIAKDAACSAKSAERAFKEPQVLAYFDQVDRHTRRVGLWFHLTPDSMSGIG